MEPTAAPPTSDPNIRCTVERRHRVLFLTPHDSVRGPMAEALLRSICENRVEVESAGISPHPIHPLTLATLAAHGVPAGGLDSRSARNFLGRSTYNTAIIIGGQDEPYRPKMFFGAVIRRIWTLSDPLTDPSPNQVQVFHQTLGALRTLVCEWWADHGRQPSLRSRQSTRPYRIAKPGHAQPGVP